MVKLLKKEIVKIVSKNEKKKPERPRRFVRKIDESVIDFACEDACVKVTNVKSVKKCSPEDEAGEGRSLLPTRTPACTCVGGGDV